MKYPNDLLTAANEQQAVCIQLDEHRKAGFFGIFIVFGIRVHSCIDGNEHKDFEIYLCMNGYPKQKATQRWKMPRDRVSRVRNQKAERKRLPTQSTDTIRERQANEKLAFPQMGKC